VLIAIANNTFKVLKSAFSVKKTSNQWLFL